MTDGIMRKKRWQHETGSTTKGRVMMDTCTCTQWLMNIRRTKKRWQH